MTKEKEEKDVRVTVKMSEALKNKLQKKAEKQGVGMSAYIRSLIESRMTKASSDCYVCLGQLESALGKENISDFLYAFIQDKYSDKGGG